MWRNIIRLHVPKVMTSKHESRVFSLTHWICSKTDEQKVQPFDFMNIQMMTSFMLCTFIHKLFSLDNRVSGLRVSVQSGRIGFNLSSWSRASLIRFLSQRCSASPWESAVCTKARMQRCTEAFTVLKHTAGRSICRIRCAVLIFTLGMLKYAGFHKKLWY